MKMLWCTSICLRYFTDGLGNSMNIHQMAIVRSLSGVHAKYGTINVCWLMSIAQYWCRIVSSVVLAGLACYFTH